MCLCLEEWGLVVFLELIDFSASWIFQVKVRKGKNYFVRNQIIFLVLQYK